MGGAREVSAFDVESVKRRREISDCVAAGDIDRRDCPRIVLETLETVHQKCKARFSPLTWSRSSGGRRSWTALPQATSTGEIFHGSGLKLRRLCVTAVMAAPGVDGVTVWWDLRGLPPTAAAPQRCFTTLSK